MKTTFLQSANSKIRYLALLMVFTLLAVTQAWGAASVSGTYTKVTTASGISAGDVVIIVNDAGTKALKSISTTNTKYGTLADVTASNGTITLENADVEEFTLETGYNSSGFSFKGSSNIADNYLYWTSGNSLNKNATKSANTSWTITFSSNTATIANNNTSTRLIRFNSDRFACYTTNTGTLAQIYKKGSSTTPTISKSSSMTAFSYSNGSPVAQSFTVSGSNLKANVVVTAPSNYQVSLDGSDWSASGGTKTITASGTLSSTAVYVRLAPSLAASSSYSGNISLTSTNATTQTIAVTGSVPYTITWMANGSTFTTTYVAVGSTLTLPASDPDPATYSCTGKSFYGWYGAGSSYSNASVAPSIAAAGDAVSADKTYYAVFATATAGADEDVTYSFLTSSDVTASTTAGWNITNTTSSYAATYGATWLRNNNASLPIFTFTPSVNVSNISIKVRQSNTTGSNTVACTVGGSSVGTTQSMSGTTQYDMEFTPGSASTGQIIITCTNGSGSGTGKGSFYVASITLTQEGTTYSNYETNCCQSLGTINGSKN